MMKYIQQFWVSILSCADPDSNMTSLTRQSFTMGGCDVQFRRAAEMAHPWKGQARLRPKWESLGRSASVALPRNGPTKCPVLHREI